MFSGGSLNVLEFGDRPAFYLLQEWAFPLSSLYLILLCFVFFFPFLFYLDSC